MATITDANKRHLVDFFRSGVKERDDLGRLGVEVEHHVLDDDQSPISYNPVDDHVGVREVLEHLATWYPQRSYNSHHDLLGLLGDEGSITLEPAAQLELSASPYTRVADVETAYRNFREHTDDFLTSRHAHLEAWGYNPHHKAQDLTLIPKKRYDFMDAYFASIGSYGDRMMRASASTQVSVDFCSEADAVRKMRMAAALAPILAAITDNTPVFEASPNHIPIRRLQLWREVDGLRCGTIPGIFEDGFGFDSYAEWLLRTPPIFVTRAARGSDGPELRPFFTEPASEAYGDAQLSPSDVEHLISMFWPDVRLKRFVEVRPADSMPTEQILGYTALVKGIFYSNASLTAIEDELGIDSLATETRAAWPLSTNDVDNAIRHIQTQGLSGLVYDKPLRDWEAMLFSLARTALPADERHYLDALESFAQNKP